MTDDGQKERAAPAQKTIELPPLLASGPAKRETRHRSYASLWLFLMLALVLALIGVSPYWAPTIVPLLPWNASLGGPAARPTPGGTPSEAGAPEPSTAALDQRLATVEQKLDQAQQPPARDPATAATLAQQQATLLALSDRIKALEQGPAPAGTDNTAALAALEGELDKLDQANRRLGAAVADANQRLDRLEQARGGERAESADRLLLIAVGELRSAVENSGPYSAELATVEALMRDNPDLAARIKPLEANAAVGVPSLAALTRSFTGQAVPAILRAATTELPHEAGWSERLWARLRALVLVRRLDTGSAEEPVSAVDKAIAIAEAALGKGDLAGAVTSVEGLTGAPAQAAAAWLADARQRLSAEALLARLSQDVAAGIGAGATTPKTVPAAAPDANN